MESGNANGEGEVGGVLIYTSSRPGVFFLTVRPWGVVPYEQRTRGRGCLYNHVAHRNRYRYRGPDGLAT